MIKFEECKEMSEEEMLIYHGKPQQPKQKQNNKRIDKHKKQTMGSYWRAQKE